MTFYKTLLSKLLPTSPFLRRRRILLPASARLLSFATPEDAAAERRRRKRRLRLEPPLSRGPAPPRAPGAPRNPNAPKFPDPASTLAGPRGNLHDRILGLIRAGDLDEAALFTRHSIYSNCKPTVFTCNAVLAALLRAGRYADLLSLHRFVTQANVVPTAATHNILLQAFCDCRRLDAALDHFRLLVREDDSNPAVAATALPTRETYRILARALAEAGRLNDCLELKDGMLKRGLIPPDPQAYAFIMSGFVNSDDGDTAISLYEEIKEKLGGGIITDGSVYGNLMKAYFLKGMATEAMDCYREILAEGSPVRFSAPSYNTVLDALGRNGKLEDALQLFERMKFEHNPPRRLTINLGSYNVMVDAYCREARYADAIAVFGEMGEKGCVPDTLSYNNLINQLGKNQLVTEAEALLKEMEEQGIKADEYTHVLLVEACVGVDRVDDAVKYFNKMFESSLRPNANAYNKVMEGLLASGRLDEAQTFFDLIPEKEAKPNITSYEILLKGYLAAGRLDDAIKIAKAILLDEAVLFSDDMKELLESALRNDGREGDMEKLYADVEREKAEAAARAAEEKAQAEALAKEEEERKKAEAAAKEEAAARASRAAIEAVLGRKKDAEKEQNSGAEGNNGVSAEGSLLERLGIGSKSVEEAEAVGEGGGHTMASEQVTTS